jgi:hypothetical protein
MKKKNKILFLSFLCALFLFLPLAVYFSFPSTTRLVFSLITHKLPDSDHLQRIRNDLLEQDDFKSILIKHERSALKRFRLGEVKPFVKKYIHKTPTSMFDIHAFHDYWEVWVRTDVIEDKPLTSFLVRLGLIKDKNAERFFSDQCASRFCKSTMKSILSIYNRMFDWGVFKPIRLNVTESDKTSGVSRKRTTLEQWNKAVEQLHSQGFGITFANEV